MARRLYFLGSETTAVLPRSAVNTLALTASMSTMNATVLKKPSRILTASLSTMAAVIVKLTKKVFGAS